MKSLDDIMNAVGAYAATAATEVPHPEDRDEIRSAIAAYGRACYEQGYRKARAASYYDEDDDWDDDLGL